MKNKYYKNNTRPWLIFAEVIRFFISLFVVILFSINIFLLKSRVNVLNDFFSIILITIYVINIFWAIVNIVFLVVNKNVKIWNLISILIGSFFNFVTIASYYSNITLIILIIVISTTLTSLISFQLYIVIKGKNKIKVLK